MDEIGIRVPAHFAIERDAYVIDCPFPAAFDEEQALVVVGGRRDLVG